MVVLMPQGWVHLSELAKSIPKEKLKQVTVKYKGKQETYWCYEDNLRMRSMGCNRVRVVVSYSKLDGEPNFYCSNKLDLKADKMLNIYAKRWKIETFYRDAKQELGMEDYEMRKIEGVRRHLEMVLIAHTFLVLGLVLSASKDGSRLNGIGVERIKAIAETIGYMRRLAYREVFLSFIIAVLKMRRWVNAEKIVSLFLSSRAKAGRNFAKV